MEQQIIWRKQLRTIFQDLKNNWIPAGLSGSGLITDLHDEATYSDYLLKPLIPFNTSCTGMDKSPKIALKAMERFRSSIGSKHNVTVCDVRHLPFQLESFDYILSHSSLDHFEDNKEICLAIREMYRVLKPGGQLILTLDNPLNPVVFIRNVIPLPLLRHLKIVPYQIGKTVSASVLQSILKEEGFNIQKYAFIDHGPRFLTVRLGKWLKNNQNARDNWLKILAKFERMGAWPTAHFTGYFYVIFGDKGGESPS